VTVHAQETHQTVTNHLCHRLIVIKGYDGISRQREHPPRNELLAVTSPDSDARPAARLLEAQRRSPVSGLLRLVAPGIVADLQMQRLAIVPAALDLKPRI